MNTYTITALLVNKDSQLMNLERFEIMADSELEARLAIEMRALNKNQEVKNMFVRQ